MRAADLARKAHLSFQINSTISRYNFNEINAIADLAYKIGAACFNPFILVPTVCDEQSQTDHTNNSSDLILDPVEYEALLNQLLEMKLSSPIDIRVSCGPSFSRIIGQSGAEKRLKISEGCRGGVDSGFISFNGDLQTCPFLNISAGNIIDEKYDFAKIWLHSKFLSEIRDKSKYEGPCAACDYRDICGGCRARAYFACGDYRASDPACSYSEKQK